MDGISFTTEEMAKTASRYYSKSQGVYYSYKKVGWFYTLTSKYDPKKKEEYNTAG